MNRTVDQEQHLAELMRAAQGGDGHAYRALLHVLLPLLRQTVRMRFSFLQTPDIEDLVQDILLSLHAARATWDPQRAFLPWLMTIARHRMADGARRYARRAAHELLTDEPSETFAAGATNMSVQKEGEADALAHALARLPRGQRQAVELTKLREMSLREAAAVTGTSVGALKVSVHRGMAALRRALASTDRE